MSGNQDETRTGVQQSRLAASTSDRVNANLETDSPPGNDASSGKISSILKKSWRPLVIGILATVTAIYGFHYKTLASPDTTGNLLPVQPSSLDVFVGNPKISVYITDTVTFNVVDAVSDVSVRIQGLSNVSQVPVFILSTVPIFSLSRLEVPTGGFPGEVDVYSAGKHPDNPEYGGVFTLRAKPGQSEITLQLRSFHIGEDIFYARDAQYASLPIIGSQDYGLDMVPATLSDNVQHTEFHAPKQLFITESLQEAAPLLQSEPIKQITPGGSLEGSDYVWNGTGVLEPTFETTFEQGVVAESNSGFLSGILFGLAGAAVIAFIQELPEVLPGRLFPTFKKRRRRI